MNRPALHFALLIVAFCAIPLVYNSCQGGLFGSKGFSSLKSHQCNTGMYKGAVAKLSDQSHPDPFAGGKVRLNAESAQGQGKVASDVVLKSGQQLSVVIDNACLQNLKAELDTTLISKAAANSGQMLADLDRQAYLWTLDKDYTESELSGSADLEPCVVGVSWNQKYKTQATFTDNSSLYQTHLGAIHAMESYDYFYNSTGGMERNTGDPVIIAVIDTGVDWQHPDIYNNLWKHAAGIGIDITTLGGTVDYNPFDASSIGHGTHVAGMIGAVTDNGQGIVGGMPFRGKIMAIKLFAKDPVTGDLSTTSQHFFNAMRFAHLNGAHVINLSLGSISNGPATDAVADSAVTEALNKGLTVVTVTGNADSGMNGAELNGSTLTVIPGIYANRAGVIGVGSIDTTTGNKSFFSHYSTTYGDIAAPGADQGSTGVYSTLPLANSGYGRLAGTSQAAPLVSAAAGLAIGIIRDAYKVTPTPAEVERLITASAVKDPKLAPYFKEGNRLDLLRLVQRINADYPYTRNTSSGSIDLSSVGCP